MNVAGRHPVVAWQIEQSWGKPAVTWFGFVAALKAARWHEAHAVEVPAYTLFLWQLPHATVVCAPVSGNFVAVLWLNVAPCHRVVVWHNEQSCENPADTWFGFVVALKAARWHAEHWVGVPA